MSGTLKYINFDEDIAEAVTNSASVEESVEWTPLDSSYGAACPMCGWIPKRIRKKVEAVILFSLATLFVSFVITASIRLSNKGNSRQKSYSVPSQFDDDVYYDDQDDTFSYYNDTDDYNSTENYNY